MRGVPESRNLRVVAAGGDGTVAWVLSTIKKLGVSPPPAVGVLPLGTGNGISVNLGWGKKTQPRSLKVLPSGNASAPHAVGVACVADMLRWDEV